MTRSGDGSTWMFTDGTTLPVGSGNIVGSAGECVEINNSGNMQPTQCRKAERYVCMAKGWFWSFLKSLCLDVKEGN